MVTYGPWIQDDDFDAEVRWSNTVSGRYKVLNYRGLPKAKVVTTEVRAEEWYNPEVLDSLLPLAFDLAIHDLNTGGGLAFDGFWPGNNLTHLQTAFDGDITEGPHTLGRVEAYTDFWPVIPAARSAGASGTFPFGYFPGEPQPDNAIGFEWEGGSEVPEWLSVQLLPTTVLGGNNYDLTSDTLAGEQPLSTAFSTDLYAGDAIVGSITSDAAPPGKVRTLDTTVDLSDHLRDAGGELLMLRLVTPTYVPPLEGTAETNGGPWYYGWDIDELRLLWTLHPPRYRWIYENESVPYLRVFPRKDSLAGGATRVYPQSNAQQTSNRTSGIL